MPVAPSDLPVQWSTMYETIFRDGYNKSIAVDQATLARIAMEIPLGDNEGNQVVIDWLGAAPQLREWLDEKQAQGVLSKEWTVKPRRWEATMSVDMDVLRDARGNVYVPKLQEMTQNAGRLRYNLLSGLIANGAAAKCYDGQNFFDSAHTEGASGAQSNKINTSGTSQAAVTNDYYTAKAALMGFLDDKGVPMQPQDFRPLVWIPNNPTLEQPFRNLQGATLLNNTNNVLANSFDLVVDPLLPAASTSWYMFRTAEPLKPFVVLNREEPHYEDDFGPYATDVFNKRVGKASVVGRMNATYLMWQKAVKMV